MTSFFLFLEAITTAEAIILLVIGGTVCFFVQLVTIACACCYLKSPRLFPLQPTFVKYVVGSFLSEGKNDNSDILVERNLRAWLRGRPEPRLNQKKQKQKQVELPKTSSEISPASSVPIPQPSSSAPIPQPSGLANESYEMATLADVHV